MTLERMAHAWLAAVTFEAERRNGIAAAIHRRELDSRIGQPALVESMHRAMGYAQRAAMTQEAATRGVPISRG